MPVRQRSYRTNLGCQVKQQLGYHTERGLTLEFIELSVDEEPVSIFHIPQAS